MRRGLTHALALWLLGCGPSGPASEDAGVAEADAGALVVAPPAEPEGPRGGCPDGWGHYDPVLPLGCNAYPNGIEACLDVEAHLPGTRGCTRVGRACGTNPWPDASPTGRNLYVAVDGAGDGTPEAPFGALADAVAAAAPGDTILLGRGRFLVPEEVRLLEAVTVRGVCAEQSVLVAETASADDAIVAVRAAVSLRDLRLTGPRVGVWVEAGGELDAAGLAFVDLAESSLAVIGRAAVADSVFRMTGASPAGGLNMGAVALEGGHITLTDSEVRGHRDLGLRARDVGSELIVERSVLGARFEGDVPIGGRVVEIWGGAHGELHGVSVDGGDPVGVFVEDAGSTALLEDVELVGVGGAEIGAAVVVRNGAQLTARRVTTFGATMAGIAAYEEGTELTLEDAWLIDTGIFGRHQGNAIQLEGATVEVRRVAIQGSDYAGLVAEHASLVVEDLRVQDNGDPGEYPVDRAAVAVYVDASDARLERIAIVRPDTHGLAITDGTATVRDLSVLNTAHHGLLGYGFGVFLLHTEATLARVHLRGNRYVGLGTMELGAVVEVEDLLVEDTLASICFDATCRSFGGGLGVVSYDGARLSLRRFELRRNALAAAQVAHGYDEADVLSEHPGELDLTDGLIEDNFVGVSVQVAGYDWDRLTNRVDYRNNEQNIDASERPVARPSGTL
ncbi:MAG: hypothetical protein R3B82_16815 [Sandaracinaceae bacterium]